MDNFEEFLRDNLPKVETFHPIYQDALSMMLTAKGKRFRPKLLLSVVEAYCQALVPSAYKVALAIEMFHTYSLIHDDLPSMDNSPLRRGFKTIHTKYDEATAVLMGDALNTDAFSLIATSSFRDDIKVELIKILSQNGGSSGMVLGQALDIYFEKKVLSLENVITLHKNKTAKLIASSLEMGAVIVRIESDVRKELYNFGIDMGILFQIQDDILDVTLSETRAGKPTNRDGDKNSFVNLLGVEGAMEYADSLALKLKDSFENFDNPLKCALRDLIDKYLHRHREKF